MKPLILAVLSDLHIGRAARSKDLCPHADTNAIEDKYLEKFLAFVQEEKIRADYLVIPGDVTHTADPSEVELASKVVTEAAGALGVPLSRLVFVPGNHDVDWSVFKSPDPTGVRRQQRYDPLRQQRWVFQKIMQSARQHILQEPYFSLWEFRDLVVVGYNSSWHDDPSISVHSGQIDPVHLKQLRSQLSKIDLSPARVRLFLVHHHPVLYADPDPYEGDFSAMINAEDLLALLREYNFDLLVHGHKHHPRIHSHIIDAGFPLVIFAAGSFSLLLDSKWSGRVNNQFHLLHVEKRDPANQCVQGKAESWTYVYGLGWTPSKRNNGIRHIELFGTYIQPHELVTALRPIIASLLLSNEWIDWQMVVDAAPSLRHLPSDRATEALDTLSSELMFKRHGQPPEATILLKER